MHRLLSILATLLLIVLCVGAAWIAYTSHDRATREVASVDGLAAGQGRWLRHDGATLYVRQWGASVAGAPTVLLVHGTGAWSGTWFALPDALVAAGWQVVAIDLPPFGLSSVEAATADYTRAAQARRIVAVVDDLARPVVLVGHSFGAGPALEAAMLAGDKVRHLVLVDPALSYGASGEAPHCDADGGLPSIVAARAIRTPLLAATATWPGFSPALLRSFVHRKDVVTPALVPAYQVPFAKRDFTAGLGDWAATFAKSACESARSLDAAALARFTPTRPVSLIWGEQDTITPIAQADALRRAMPGTSVRTLAGVGHIPHIEDPAAFAAALLAELDGDRR